MPSTNKSPAKTIDIPDKLYFKIGEVSSLLSLKAYVLRYWETEFPELAPVKSRTNQRLYKRKDVEVLVKIRHLLYEEKFTINGARKRIKAELKAKDAPQLDLGLGAKDKSNDAHSNLEFKNILSKISSEMSSFVAE